MVSIIHDFKSIRANMNRSTPISDLNPAPASAPASPPTPPQGQAPASGGAGGAPTGAGVPKKGGGAFPLPTDKSNPL